MGCPWYGDLDLPDDQNAEYPCDFMEYMGDELAAILGENFPISSSPAGSDSSISSTAKANVPPSNSATPVGADLPQLGLEPPPKQPKTKSSGNLKRRRQPSQVYDHIAAERKRREQLSERFIALSAIVPGLKKMDKSSVLGDAIKYLKNLQERVKTLEEQAAQQSMESVVLVKKSHIMEDEGCSGDKTGRSDEQRLPEIEARVCNKTILLKVHCENSRGLLVKLFGGVDQLNLTVLSSCVAPFGSLALDITIVAQMEKESSLSAEEIVRTLRCALRTPYRNLS